MRGRKGHIFHLLSKHFVSRIKEEDRTRRLSQKLTLDAHISTSVRLPIFVSDRNYQLMFYVGAHFAA